MRVLYWGDVVFFLALGGFLLAHPHRNLHFLIGLGIAVVAFPVWMLARIQLGKSFSFRAHAKALVTTGLYSKFRHPIYLFGGLAFLGLFIAWNTLIGFVWFVLQLPIQLSRIRKEEAALEQAFGDEYRRYRTSTWL